MVAYSLSRLAVFFPNNDVAPARRLRIQKAMEYGANWAKDWGDNITHVIVDKDLLFQDVLKFLKLDHLPVCSFSHDVRDRDLC